MKVTVVLAALLLQSFAYDFKPLSEFTTTMQLNTAERVQLDKECGTSTKTKDGNIERREAPWMVSFNDGCTGALISRRHILAPAKCFEGKDVSTVKLFSACTKKTENCSNNIAEEITIALELYPSEFLQKEAPRKHFADIALIVLEKDVTVNKEVTPVCLAGDATAIESSFHQYFYSQAGYLNKKSSQRIYCPWGPQEPDYFCASSDNHKEESVYVKQTNNKNYLVAIGHPIDDGHHRLGHGTFVAPHLFWICEASGVCVKNKSGESLDHTIIHKSVGQPAKYVRVPLE